MHGRAHIWATRADTIELEPPDQTTTTTGCAVGATVRSTNKGHDPKAGEWHGRCLYGYTSQMDRRLPISRGRIHPGAKLKRTLRGRLDSCTLTPCTTRTPNALAIRYYRKPC